MSYDTPAAPSTFPEAWKDYLARFVSAPSDHDTRTLALRDRTAAARVRDRLAASIARSDAPRVHVLDLAGVSFTPSALQELVLPLAQRIRGGEYGMVRLVISTADPGVGDFIRYMAHAHDLPLYLADSPSDLSQGAPLGVLTRSKLDTLNTINVMGGQVTASSLAAASGIRANAATNRLATLDREGYLIRQPRGRRDGDLFVEPRATTTVPVVCAEAYREAHAAQSGIRTTGN